VHHLKIHKKGKKPSKINEKLLFLKQITLYAKATLKNFFSTFHHALPEAQLTVEISLIQSTA
jgi:hypothetical protein